MKFSITNAIASLMKVNVEYGLRHADLGDDFTRYLKELVKGF